MSIIKIRSSNKWAKDTYGAYKLPRVLKITDKKNDTRDIFYRNIMVNGRSIQENTHLKKMANKLYKNSNQEFIKIETLEKVLLSFKETNLVTRGTSHTYNDVLYKRLIKNKVDKKVIKNLLPKYKIKTQKFSNKDVGVYVKRNNELVSDSKEEKARILNNKISMQKKPHPHQEKLNKY